MGPFGRVKTLSGDMPTAAAPCAAALATPATFEPFPTATLEASVAAAADWDAAAALAAALANCAGELSPVRRRCAHCAR